MRHKRNQSNRATKQRRTENRRGLAYRIGSHGGNFVTLCLRDALVSSLKVEDFLVIVLSHASRVSGDRAVRWGLGVSTDEHR